MVEQIVRPTGLLDPKVEVRPSHGARDDLLREIAQRTQRDERVLVTTLTKVATEELHAFLESEGIRARLQHSDIKVEDRVAIIGGPARGRVRRADRDQFAARRARHPEASLIAIFDADRAGFLRSAQALIQMIGRVARNVNGNRCPLRRYGDAGDAGPRSMRPRAGDSARSPSTRRNDVTPLSSVRGLASAQPYGQEPSSIRKPSARTCTSFATGSREGTGAARGGGSRQEDGAETIGGELDGSTVSSFICDAPGESDRMCKDQEPQTTPGKERARDPASYKCAARGRTTSRMLMWTFRADAFVVFTGISGSGKSSLAFGTLYAEAQRRYLESVAHLRPRLFDQAGVPEVDAIDGLPPAVALQQQRGSANARSSVGSVTTLSAWCGCSIRASENIAAISRCSMRRTSPPTPWPGPARPATASGASMTRRRDDGARRQSHHSRSGDSRHGQPAWHGQNLRDISLCRSALMSTRHGAIFEKDRDWILFTDETPTVPVYAGLTPEQTRVALKRRMEPSYQGTFSGAVATCWRPSPTQKRA